MHAGPPVIGVLAPQRRHHILAGDLLALAIAAMADRALRLEDLLATLEVIPAFRPGHLGVTPAGNFHPRRGLGRKPVGIYAERGHLRAVGGRWLAVHAELETALDAFGEGVDLVVLLAISRIHRIGAPQRRGMGQTPLVEVAIAAVQAIAHGLGHQAPGVDEQRMPLADHLAEGIVRDRVLARRHELRHGLSARHLELGLVFHGDRRRLGTTHGQQQQGWNHGFHGLASWAAGWAKYSATALTSASVIALATLTIN